MNSKQKFIKNKYWKKKYKRNAVTNNTNAVEKVEKSNRNLSESELKSDDESLKQPIPLGGWFPEYDSSSSSEYEDFNQQKCDKNWFDKELDNVQVDLENSIEKKLNTEQNDDESKNKLKKNSNNIVILDPTLKKNILQEKSKKDDNSEEEELEFLLSLKEPVQANTVTDKRKLNDERKATTYNTSQAQQKPIKSIDLEKWLDSVLDK